LRPRQYRGEASERRGKAEAALLLARGCLEAKLMPRDILRSFWLLYSIEKSLRFHALNPTIPHGFNDWPYNSQARTGCCDYDLVWSGAERLTNDSVFACAQVITMITAVKCRHCGPTRLVIGYPHKYLL